MDIGPLRRIIEVEPSSLPVPEHLPEPASVPEPEPVAPAGPDQAAPSPSTPGP
jgi:hypothetical protein